MPVTRGHEHERTCARGFTPQDLVGYLRSMGPRDEDPPKVIAEHLKECKICEYNWDFIWRTDPVVRKRHADAHRGMRLVIERVLGEEEPIPVPGVPVGLSPSQKQAATNRIAAALRGNNAEEISHKAVPEICRESWSIQNDEDRYLHAVRVSAIFKARAESQPVKGQSQRDDVDRTIWLANGVIDGGPDSLALTPEDAEFLLSYWQVLYFSVNPLLFWDGDKPDKFSLNCKAWREQKNKFEEIRKQYEPQVSNV